MDVLLVNPRFNGVSEVSPLSLECLAAPRKRLPESVTGRIFVFCVILTAPCLKDLEDMATPAFQLLDNRGYRTRSLSSSRGCYHNCRFCSIQSLYQGMVRPEPLEKILIGIRDLRNAGAKRIMFTDDNFTFHPRRVREICGMMIQEGLAQGVEFYVQGRIDDFCRQPVMAQWLSEAGFKAVYVGAESGAQEILDRYGKGMATADLKRGVSYCIEQNLMPVVSFILFGPWDTGETMLKTIRLAKELFANGAEIAYTECLIPFPGTPVQGELKKDGKWRESKGVYSFESYTDMAMDRVLKTCDLARAMARLIYGDEALVPVRRVYYEFSLLEYLIQGQRPPVYDSWLVLLSTAGRDDAREKNRRQIEAAMGDILSITSNSSKSTSV